MGILQIFTNSFDLIWGFKSKVKGKQKKNKNERRRKKTGPNQFGPFLSLSSPLSSPSGPAQLGHDQAGTYRTRFGPLNGSIDSIVSGNVCLPSFQTVTQSNFYISTYTSPNPNPFVSTYSLLQIAHIHRSNHLYCRLLPFSFRSSEILNSPILFRYF